ncbi:MAG: electron transport complex subunit RsxA, partial [Bacteroidales bacterium]|nr:electron transport complex subunit RsxA [Bacteroidales bacterium]
MEYLIIIISAVFVNNVVLSQFLGICPFLGVSKKVSTAFGMSLALVLVMGLATLVTYLIQNYVLINTWFGEKMDITFMQTIVFILVIAALVQMVEIILKKINPTLYQAL